MVAKPVGALDGVVEVIVPIVIGHVAQCSANTALSRHGVRAGGEYFGENSNVQTSAGQLQGGAHTGAAGTDDHDVKFTRGDLVFGVSHGV